MSRSRALLFVLLIGLSTGILHAQSPELPVDWLLLIDTSQSMVGKGGSANIFPRVQRALKSFVRNARPGDTIAIYTFDSAVREGQSILLGSEEDKRRLVEQIDNLKAKGLFTHTGEAFYSALVRQGELHPASSQSNRKGFIVLFTDGVEDTRDHPSVQRIEDIEIPPKNRRPYSILVWLGKDVEEFEQSSLAGLRARLGDEVEVLQHPQARDIDNVSTQLRQIATQAARNRVELNTLKVDFGTLASELGAKSEEREIIVYSDQDTRIAYDFNDPRVKVTKPDGPLSLIPGDNKLPFVLQVSKEGDYGDFTTELGLYRLGSEDEPGVGKVVVTYSIKKPSYAGIAAIVLLSFGALAVTVQRFRTQRFLFGVFDVTNRAGGSGPNQIELSSLKARKAHLASLLGLAPASGDAELSVGNQENGDRVLRLSKVVGSVFLNNRPLSDGSVEELYNGDRLALGDGGRTTLRYSGPERPERSEELR